MSETILEVKNLNKVYDNGVHALKNVSFTVKEGEFLGIIGLSGSGKSTLLRCINRLVEPSSGEIHFRRQAQGQMEEITKMSRSELRMARQKMGMVFQHFNLVERKSVIKNVLTGSLGGMSTARSLVESFSSQQQDEAKQYLKLVGLADKTKYRAGELSGGQKQRVAIARSLMQKPRMLLADEPVASLDPATSHSVMQYLEKANKDLGQTILCNLHFLSLVRQYTHRVIAMKAGEIVFEGDSKEIDEAWFQKIYGEDAKEVEIR